MLSYIKTESGKKAFVPNDAGVLIKENVARLKNISRKTAENIAERIGGKVKEEMTGPFITMVITSEEDLSYHRKTGLY